MKLAIIGTRGIPNNYGGFEQFAEYLSVALKKSGHEVYVYCPHDHPFKEHTWKEVKLLHQYNPENLIGTAGQFIYDLNCFLDTRKKKFDVILQLGYTSSSIWNWLIPPHSVLVTNMDGLEWKRTKYKSYIKAFLRYAESLAVKKSDLLISDSIGIQDYISSKYKKSSYYIPYGAELFNNQNESILEEFDLAPFGYDMLVARLEPENNIEMILEGRKNANSSRSFIVIGNFNKGYGSYIYKKYKDNIKFLGSMYDISKLNNLRYFSNLYFHGHSVGGTNPSLLEAMASSALICAHKNEFNSHILNSDAYYFFGSNCITYLIEKIKKDSTESIKIKNNRNKISDLYSWERITKSYEEVLLKGVKND